MIINLKSQQTDLIKQVKLGFSWTMLFFGLFVPLLRGDLKWSLITFLISLFTFGIGGIILAFIYNKIYIKEMIEKGYLPADESSEQALNQGGIVFAKQNK